MSRTSIMNCLKQQACFSVSWKNSVALASLLLITGCSSTVETVTKVAEVIYDPDIQVGSNEMQPSELSISALTVNADTTVSNTKKRSFFSAKVRKGFYLFRLYQIDNKMLASSEGGILNANQVLKVMQGEYLEKHQFYLKRDGYRFIKHFKVDKEVAALLALVHFEEPQCSVWTTLNVVKNIGEEYNYFLKADERSFIFKSELDVSAPGEPIKIDNRFIGTCKNQVNASAADVLEIEEDQDIIEAIQQHQGAASLATLNKKGVEDANGYKEQLVLATKDKKSGSQIKDSSNNIKFKAPNSNKPVKKIQEPRNARKVVVVEDYQLDKANKQEQEIETIKLPPKVVVKKESLNKQSSGNSNDDYSSEEKLAISQKATVPIKTTNDVIDDLVKKKIHTLVLSPKQLAALPKYQNEQGNHVYFVTGIGRIKTTNESLNIRQAPGVSSPKIATIQDKKSVQVQQYTPDLNGWLYIESEGVKPGWVSEPFVDWKPW